MSLSESVGFLAAVLSSASFVPQAYKSWKTKDLSGISLPMYSIFVLAVVLWLIYGLLINSIPVVLANIVTLIPASFVLILKIFLK